MRGTQMLPRTTDSTPGGLRLLLGALLAGAVLIAAGPRARADEETAKTASALAKVPDDAAFFSTSLRNKEQLDLFLKSNAYKTIRSLPAVKAAEEKAKAELAKDPNNPLQRYKKFTAQKENKELV